MSKKQVHFNNEFYISKNRTKLTGQVGSKKL